jgi:hypothetical protein
LSKVKLFSAIGGQKSADRSPTDGFSGLWSSRQNRVTSQNIAYELLAAKHAIKVLFALSDESAKHTLFAYSAIEMGRYSRETR